MGKAEISWDENGVKKIKILTYIDNSLCLNAGSCSECVIDNNNICRCGQTFNTCKYCLIDKIE